MMLRWGIYIGGALLIGGAVIYAVIRLRRWRSAGASDVATVPGAPTSPTAQESRGRARTRAGDDRNLDFAACYRGGGTPVYRPDMRAWFCEYPDPLRGGLIGIER